MLRKALFAGVQFFKKTIPMRLVGTTAVGFAGGMAFQANKQQIDPAKAHEIFYYYNIQKKLQMTEEEKASLLKREADRYDKTQKELEDMELLLPKDKIDKAIDDMANKIAEEFKNEKHLFVLTMLQGASYFATDLQRKMCEKGLLFKEEAIRITRYGDSHHGDVPKIEKLPDPTKIVGRKILIIEDLIEEGVTLEHTIRALEKLGAKREDIYIAAFTDKINARRKDCEHIRPNFSGFIMQNNKWVVGYGCDQSGYGRPKQDLFVFPEEMQQKHGYRK